MTHKVEISDTDGLPMRLLITADFPIGGTWYLLSPKMINHHNGFLADVSPSGGWFSIDGDLQIWAHGGHGWGIKLDKFTTWNIVNREGTGTLEDAWGTPKGLVPGDIEWSIVH
jgi:hypothetical protein